LWIFPKGDDIANVGIGIGAKTGRSAKKLLDDFIAKHQTLSKGSIVETVGGGIPVGGFVKELAKDNMMVVGDAARQVNPMHGGGMHEAMLAGRLAGQAAVDAIQNNDLSLLKGYTEKWWAERGPSLMNVLKIRHFFEKLTDDDFNLMADHLSPEAIVAITHGDMKVILSEVSKHPQILGIFKKLI